MNLSIRELNAFIYVAQLGSFTRAAERMHVTQAGLSTMIRSLETQLDCRLFNRTTRAVSLTDAGTALLPVARRAISELEAVAAQIGAMNATVDRTLRIGATALVCSGYLPSICQEFLKAHPGISLEVFEIPFPRVHAEVEAGRVDIGLCVDVIPQSSIERHPLFPVSLALISKSLPARKSGAGLRGKFRPMRWADLPDAPMIALKPDDPLQRYIDRHLGRVGRLAPATMAVGSVETQIAMVEAGLGAAIVPSLALRTCGHLDFETSCLTDPEPDLEFCCLSKSGRRRTHVMDDFIEIATRGFMRALGGRTDELMPAAAPAATMRTTNAMAPGRLRR